MGAWTSSLSSTLLTFLRPCPRSRGEPVRQAHQRNLGFASFEVYQVELPPGEQTAHSHLEDLVEDVYVVIAGDGWLVVDGESVPITTGQFSAVTLGSTRHVLAGPKGLTLVAICGG